MAERNATELGQVRTAAVVLACAELQPNIDFFVERVGMRLEQVSPADDPREALVAGHGLRILLRRGSEAAAGRLSILRAGGGDEELRAPNGTWLELRAVRAAPVIPAGSDEFVVTRARDGDTIAGRAGMQYRDLIPSRLGGRFIASLIRTPEGGPVPDNVHFHAIRFQVIVCLRGWVRVVYEDEGEPFVLAAGDAVLQPPRIRHRVLESSAGLEVLELACPAEHDTFIDHALELPNELRVARDLGGQRFVRFVASQAAPTTAAGFESVDTGIAGATDGLASVRFVRATETAERAVWRHAGELLFAYLLDGALTLRGVSATDIELQAGDSVVVPRNDTSALVARPGARFLEVRLPGRCQD